MSVPRGMARLPLLAAGVALLAACGEAPRAAEAGGLRFEALAERGAAQVHVPDLRGHGVSPERRGDVDHAAQLEQDVADLVAHVRGRHPGARVAVGGHSSGGGLALRYAADARGLAGLLLLAPYLGHDAPTTRPGSGGFVEAHVGRILVLRALNALGVERWNDAVVLELDVPAPWRDGTETRAYSYRLATGLAPRDAARELEALEAPLLVLVGARDEAFRAGAYAPLVARHAPEGAVRVLEGVSHLGLVGAPETLRHAAAWLEALPGGEHGAARAGGARPPAGRRGGVLRSPSVAALPQP